MGTPDDGGLDVTAWRRPCGLYVLLIASKAWVWAWQPFAARPAYIGQHVVMSTSILSSLSAISSPGGRVRHGLRDVKPSL